MSRPFSRSVLAAAFAVAAFGVAPVSAEEARVSFEDAEERKDEAGGGGGAKRSRAAQTRPEPKTPWMGDAVTVTAKGTAADFPSALATDVLEWQDAVGSPSDFQDLITRVPGIGATGQNGLLETFSIRGSGGSGILVLVGGMPVTAQRRAGVPVTFVEPALLGEINVTRGPAVVHFGPGALGGAISIEPRWIDGYTIARSYANSGDEASFMSGFGNDTFSVAAASHAASDSEAANGTPLNLSFERDSASLQFRINVGAFALDGLLLPSRTRNIGKSNSRYPTRNTTYPEDSHTLGRLRLRHDNGFEARVHGHDQTLVTYNQRAGFADTYAVVESRDVGATAQQTFVLGDFSYDIGVEALNRRDVTGFDARTRLNNRTYSLRDAGEDGWSVFALSDWQAASTFAMEFGARFSAVDQENRGADASDSDSALTVGAIYTPTASSRWTLNVATGFRFATLEERYFSGVTAQGQIVGNPDLSAEHSRGVDLGYGWHSNQWGTEVHVWRTDIRNQIVLNSVQPGLNGYTNVSDAELHGLEGVVGWTPTTQLSLRASATVVRSIDELTHQPLYGSPPLTASLEAKFDFGDFTAGAFYSHRWRMNRPGFEEVERDAVDVVDLDLTWHLRPTLDLQLFVRNAFDSNYFATADALSAYAPERSVGLTLTWMAH